MIWNLNCWTRPGTSSTGLNPIPVSGPWVNRADENGNWRFTLNGKETFHLGTLDQGWWPGSFLNPPSDEAIVFEMKYLKASGFNMIRKHKKAEPRRYYYHADRIGLLVWQDQTSGGSGPNEWPKWKKLHALREDYKPRSNRRWASEEDAVEADWPDWGARAIHGRTQIHDRFALQSPLHCSLDYLQRALGGSIAPLKLESGSRPMILPVT